MLRRPKASDSESDLLAFQEQFLASKEKPAVSLVGGREGKRRELSGERDVVQLEGERALLAPLVKSCRDMQTSCPFVPCEGPPSTETAQLPTAKRSKFKESRQRHDVS